jgi:hypothetical protein
MICEYGAVGGTRIGNGKLKYLEKHCPSVTLSTINPTQSGWGLNPNQCSGELAANSLTYGMAFIFSLTVMLV